MGLVGRCRRHHPAGQRCSRPDPTAPGRSHFVPVVTVQGVPPYPSLKARELRRILEREPLSYVAVRSKGSHVKLVSPKGYGELLFAFHDGQNLPPGLVRNILVKQVGLNDDEALALL